MYINEFLFGVMCTIFAEMALILVAYFLPIKKNKHESKRRENARKDD